MERAFLPIKSSHLLEACYDNAGQKLQVRFHNGLYEYDNVSPELYKKFEATFQTDESSGRFFTQHIRPLKYKRIEG